MVNSIKSFAKIDKKDTDHGFGCVECVFPLMSLWISVGGIALGIGRMSAHFHSMGTVPSRRLLLKIAQTGGARMVA